MEIRIGTSGWSYDDWVGCFYPERLRSAKSEWLDYYGQYLNTVEINSTFYRVPNDHIINSWIKKGKRLKHLRLEDINDPPDNEIKDTGIKELLQKLDITKRVVISLYYFEQLFRFLVVSQTVAELFANFE